MAINATEGVVDLGIDLAKGYVASRSIDFREARQLIRGKRGPVNMQVLRRWANPKKGCKPLGKCGPVLFLPALLINGVWRTMPEWCAAFEAMRVELAAEAARPGLPLLSHVTQRQRDAAFLRAEAELDRMGVPALGRPGVEPSPRGGRRRA